MRKTQILKSIIINYNGGPVGIETLSLLLGEDKRTLEEVYEPYLVKIGFIKTSSSRTAIQNSDFYWAIYIGCP